MKDDKIIVFCTNCIIVLKALATFGAVVLGILPKLIRTFRSKKDNNPQT